MLEQMLAAFLAVILAVIARLAAFAKAPAGLEVVAPPKPWRRRDRAIR